MTALLLDQNRIPKLVSRFAKVFPGSAHVSQVGLSETLDRTAWDYARSHNFVLVSKDADFSELGLLLGFPPKVAWIRRGNCSTREIEQLLRDSQAAIDALAQDEESGILALF